MPEYMKNPRAREAAASTTTLQVGVVRNGRAQLVPITIGRDDGATVEVVSGLTPADAVVINPSDSLISGQPVRIVRTEGIEP